MKIMISFQVDTSDEAQAVIAAVAAIGKEPHACSKQYVDPSTEFSDRRVMHGRRAGEADSAPVLDEKSIAARAALDKVSIVRPNVSPGTPLITKIGSNTKAEIMDIMQSLRDIPAKYKEHLKLLWARGEVKYDGTEFYI